jgi:signal transduction histidine kinase
MPSALIVGAAVLAVQAAILALLLARRSAVRRLEEAVRDGEIRHRATLQALPDMLFILSRDGVYLDFYAPDASVLYASPDRFLGKHSRDVMPPELAPRFERAFAEALASATPVVLEYSLELASGRCEFEARIVRCGDDRLLSIVRDVTAGKASVRAVAAGVGELSAANLRNQTLAARLIVAQEAERQRIARDLHDDLSQKLAVLNIEVSRLAANSPADLTRRADAISGLVGEIAEHVHDLSRELHPSRPEALGLVPAVRGICADAARQHAIVVDFRDEQVPSALEAAVSLCAYRIVQEGLRNVVRHSGAARAEVVLKGLGAALELTICDEGRGFEPEAAGPAGLGLLSMRERVKLLGGEINIRSRPGSGVRLEVRLPLIGSGTFRRATDEQRTA